MNSSIVTSSFVVISDFHGYMWPLDKIVNNYLNEYETIYILGDATDRGKDLTGTGSLETLMNIKKLSDKYPGRVVYIPGNHDSFIYDYASYGDKTAELSLMRNGGSGTIEDYNFFMSDSKTRDEITELINWLGKLPLQKIHYYNGKRFVLAHALFNQRLYENNPKLSLKDLYTLKVSNPQEYESLLNIIWFRKNSSDFSYNPKDLPSGKDIMVIGHTPLRYRGDQNLDLMNSNGEQVKVFCVDGGVAYDGKMLKFDGDDQVFITLNMDHQNTSPKYKEMDNSTEDSFFLDEIDKTQKLLEKIIIDILKSDSTMDYCYNLLVHLFSTGESVYYFQDKKTVSKTPIFNIEDINNVFKFYYYLKNNKIPSTVSKEIYIDFICETALDYVIDCLELKYNSKQTAAKQINQLFIEEDFSYITNTIGKARIVARKIGVNNLKRIIRKNNCSFISDYIKSKYGIDVIL